MVERPKTDLRHQELTTFITALSERNFSDFNLFVLFVLSHGSNGDVIACWDSSYNVSHTIDEIVDRISSNPTIEGFPKLFFFDCCRGGTTDIVGTRDSTKDLKKFSDTNPLGADIFTGYATSRGITSSSHSPYIK